MLSGNYMPQSIRNRFVRHLVQAIMTQNMPITFMENEDLRKASSIAGCGDLPSRTATASTLLDQVFEGVETANAQTLGSTNLIDAASEGWRKKYCAKGTGDALQNQLIQNH
jgi:hypothetical protein